MTEDRKPFWVKCPTCSHHWIAAYTPLPVETFVRIVKGAACPMCGEAKGITPTSGGHSPPQPGAVDDVAARLVAWLSSDDTGVSSKAIGTHMTGGTVDRWGWGYPSDPDDLGRCLRLLELFPEWKPRIAEMATRGPGWAGLVARWNEIAKSMTDEVGISWEKGKSAPITYDLMKVAIGEGYRADPDYECTFNERGHLRSSCRKSAA